MSDKQSDETTLRIDPEKEFASEAPQAAGTSPPPAESLSQVREILLGPVSRDLENRLARVEERLDQSLRNLEQTLVGRVEELQSRLNDELERLRQDTSEQREKAAILSEELAGAQQTLREELAGQTGRLRAELVDRDTMSSLFSELALRVGGPVDALSADPAHSEAELDNLLGATIAGDP